MDSTVENLEDSIKKADGRLDRITWRLNVFEEEIADAVLKNGERDSVVSLLQSVSQVTEEYDHLRQDLNEVQELQSAIQDSVCRKANEVQQTMLALKKRISYAQTRSQQEIQPRSLR